MTRDVGKRSSSWYRLLSRFSSKPSHRQFFKNSPAIPSGVFCCPHSELPSQPKNECAPVSFWASSSLARCEYTRLLNQQLGEKQ